MESKYAAWVSSEMICFLGYEADAMSSVKANAEDSGFSFSYEDQNCRDDSESQCPDTGLGFVNKDEPRGLNRRVDDGLGGSAQEEIGYSRE